MNENRIPESSKPTLVLPGVHGSPNIQTDADVYEIENNAVDPDQLIERSMWRIAPWDNKVVLDLGSGTGFHIPRFHRKASHVIGIEPHGPSHLRALARVSSLGLERASLIRGSAADIPLKDASVDVVHARFAYFFGPGCEPGLAELQRVIKPSGTAFIIDNNLTDGEFAAWLRMEPAWGDVSPAEGPEFFESQGFEIERIRSEWQFKRRKDLEAVVRIEFSSGVADTILRQHSGTRVSYHFLLMYRRY